MYQQDPWSSPPPSVTAPPTSAPLPPAVPRPSAPPPRRNSRPVVITAIIAGAVVVLAVAGTLFATGAVDLSGAPDDDETKDSRRAQPDEPSVNPDDTRYETAAGLCEDLDVSAYEAMVPGPEKMAEEVEEDPYLFGGTEIKCEQTFATEKQFVYLTVKVIAYPSVLRARLDGYSEYSTFAFEELEQEPSWSDGDWEKAQIVEGNETDQATTAFIAQDDNLALAVTVKSMGVDGIEQSDTTDAVLASVTEVLKACEA